MIARNMHSACLALALFLALLAGCKKPAEEGVRPAEPAASAEAKEGDEAHGDKDEHEELPLKVRLRDEVIQASGIEVAPVQRESLRSTLTLSGEVTVDPDRSARISSPVAGRLDQVAMREGSEVKKGDLLAVVRVPELGKVRGTLASSRARAKAARANAERLHGLVSSRLTSEQAYLDAKAEADALDAEVAALSSQLAGMGATGDSVSGVLLSLRAPLSGTIIARDALVGQPVLVEQSLGLLTDLSELWFLARVFEKDLGRLQTGAEAEVELNAYPSARFSGKVEYIGQQIDPIARTITARIRLKNADGRLRVGLFGSAQVALSDAHDVPTLVVPRKAVIELANKSVVFVRQPDGQFERHDVTLGASAPGKVQILSGLREGEQVVVEGAFTLKSAVLKGTLADED